MNKLKEKFDRNERRYVAISIKHSSNDTKFAFLGSQRTKDDERRWFLGYTYDPYNCELYSLSDWDKHKPWFKHDVPVDIFQNDTKKEFCNRWKEFNTVLVDFDDLIANALYVGVEITPMHKYFLNVGNEYVSSILVESNEKPICINEGKEHYLIVNGTKIFFDDLIIEEEQYDEYF